MNADGSGQTDLLNTTARTRTTPIPRGWPRTTNRTGRPTGANRVLPGGAALAEIYVMNADGSGQTSLTDDPAA